MIRGVLFDMDGILLDSERLGRSIFQQACRERGYEVDNDRYARLLGVTRANCSRLLKEQLGEAFPYDEVYEIYREGLRTHALDGTLPVKKGLQACMDGLKARGIRIALATSTPRQQVELYQQHIPAMKDAFDFMVCGGEARSKPDPDIYLKAAQGLGLTARECAGVEDSLAGIQSISAAGCVRVMIPDLLPCDGRFEGLTDYCLESLEDLCPLVDEINQQGK